MNIIQRVKELLLNPGATWSQIEAEPATPQSLFVPYVLVLAAIPAIASFIGLSVLGMGMMGMNFRIPVGAGLNMALTTYVLSVVMVGFLGWLTSTLAPTFGGQLDLVKGLKCAVYASTPGFVAGVFNIFPVLSIIGVLASLFGLYLLYLGLPVLMKNPKEKTPIYMVALVVAAIVSSVLISAITGALMPRPGMGGFGGLEAPGEGAVQITPSAGGTSADGNAAITIKTAEGEVKIDAKKMEELAKQMEALAAKQSK